ncbi:tail fiber protein [Escherichia phage ST31]|uniref:Tail fiber protein n=1 Tax=Escherichia phage ST31 TaxID=1983789 RepID=A0A1Z1LW25_9CAUD|nr:tail protein [Escherichia phage ST31]ARW56875.1 tail fiber protein [Escherichia phage ST31]
MSTITQFPSGNTQYRIEFDYLARTFVVVTLVNSSNPTLNRVLEVGRDYRFLNPTMIEMLIDQSGFDIVRIHRQTGTDLVVDFRNGSVLTASDLTNAELQAIHIAEEGRDQTVDLAKEYADAAGDSAGNAKDSEDEARQIAAGIKAAGLLGYITRRSFEKGFNVTTWNEVLLWEEDGAYYRWDGTFPKNVPAGSTPESSGGIGLGAWVSVGDASLRQWVYKNTTIAFNSVSELMSGTLPSGESAAFSEGMTVKTYKNKHGIKSESDWLISTTQDNATYSIPIAGGFYANLIVRERMCFAEFGYGSANPADNPLAVDEACRVARANPVVHTLVFPSGSFQCSDTIRLDVDRRGFTFDGAGRDNSIILSSASDISLHHVGIDPRNSTRDRLHWHQTVKGFTVNGQVDSLAASAARRTVSTAPYGIYGYKSINHRISNYDVLHLVGQFDAFSQGATSGSTHTQYGMRVRNNSNKVTGYIGGASRGCTVSIEGGRTSLTVAANAGDTTITVANAAAFDTLFELGFGSPLVETKRIASINGNVITLDKGLTNSYASGSVVEVPCIANAVTNATIETGEIRIGDSQATYMAGNYSEEAKIYITKYVRALTITGMSTAESSPAITIDVDKRSSIKIEGNDTTFSIAVNITDRSGSVGERIDLYNAPKLDISMNTRVQNPILLNGVYGLSSLKIDKTFDTVIQDDRFTRMTFSGFNYVAPAGGSTAEVMKFFQDATQFGFDGYTFDLDIVCRRDGNSSAVTPGILKRYGTSSAAPVAQNSAPVSLFSDFNASTGYDVFIGASGNRGTVQIRPNPTSAIKAAISGTVTSAI